MAITVRNFKTRDHLVIVWRNVNDTGASLVNPIGVAVSHETRCTEGSVEIRFGERRSVALATGESITLPLKVPYDVVSLTPTSEVTCFWPLTREAEDDTAGFTREGAEGNVEREWTTFREEEVKPHRDTDKIRPLAGGGR